MVSVWHDNFKLAIDIGTAQDGTDADSDDDYSSQSPKTPVEIATVIPKRKASDVEEEDSFDDATSLKKTRYIRTSFIGWIL